VAVEDDFLALIPQLRDWANVQPGIKRLWVYGSRLRGTQRDDSDLDIAIEIGPLETQADRDIFWGDVKPRWIAEFKQMVRAMTVHLEMHVPDDPTLQVTQYISSCSMLVFQRDR
jgi:uncharacterized protein